VTPVVLLYLMATLDATLSGYRAAGGRKALIRKGGYLLRAQMVAALLGQVCVVSIAAVVGLTLLAEDDPPALAADLLAACRRLMTVYLPYSLVFVVALSLQAVPSVDLRSILNVLVFGPFTLLRPFVGLAGLAWAFAAEPRWQVLLIGAYGLGVMLALEWLLDRLYARAVRGPGRRPSL
jgi:hypothetical protein